MRTCNECDAKHYAKGLCRKHYAKAQDKRSLRHQVNADAKYRRWLMSTPRVPADLVRPWVDILLDRYEGNIAATAREIRVDEAVLRRLVKSGKSSVTALTAEAIAVATGHIVELAMALPEEGREGWSEVGRYCGDRPEGDLGCGSWFHEHFADGLCEECAQRVMGLIDVEPRDARVSREVLA